MINSGKKIGRFARERRVRFTNCFKLKYTIVKSVYWNLICGLLQSCSFFCQSFILTSYCALARRGHIYLPIFAVYPRSVFLILFARQLKKTLILVLLCEFRCKKFYHHSSVKYFLLFFANIPVPAFLRISAKLFMHFTHLFVPSSKAIFFIKISTNP